MDDKNYKQDKERIILNLQMQLDELESLQSMFCNPGEVRVEDIATLADINSFINGSNSEDLPLNLDLTISLLIGDSKFELCVSLSHDYPQTVGPEIFVRNHKLNRVDHMRLNKDLNEFVESLEKGDPCIFNAISWLQDNAEQYLESSLNNPNNIIKNPSKNAPKIESLVRYWIYSHHIYSKTKRREIIDSAQSLGLTGFSLPGKPGIICVEGVASDCDEWWSNIKSMNWKKIFCKVHEEDTSKDKKSFLKFSNFQEITFQNSGVKCNHMDMGGLYKYLEGHSVGYIFKELFGVEAKAIHSNNSNI